MEKRKMDNNHTGGLTGPKDSDPIECPKGNGPLHWRVIVVASLCWIGVVAAGYALWKLL